MVKNAASHPLLDQADALSAKLAKMDFQSVATNVYNPFEYARLPLEQYFTRFAQGRKQVIFLGMNPGPFGMAQTGVPFGEIDAVRDWMGIQASVEKPADEHPARPVEGFDCPRSEVSGRRLWGLFAERFGKAEAFFEGHFVANYCPLLFLHAEGKRCRNLTPDKFPQSVAGPLFQACDAFIREMVVLLEPEWVIGVGKFAEGRAREIVSGMDVKVGTVLHPSPASPAANRGWAEQATRQLEALGVW